jgi:hypothetical protein
LWRFLENYSAKKWSVITLNMESDGYSGENKFGDETPLFFGGIKPAL